MPYTKFQITIVGLLLIICSLLAWYVFNQSTKIKDLKTEKTLVKKESSLGDKKETNNTNASSKELTLAENKNQTELGDEKLKKEAVKSSKEKATQKNAFYQENEVITPYFIENLAEYLVSLYFPGGTVQNPSSEGILEINIKSVNARYGLDLTGLEHRSNTIQKAREEILSYVMNSEIIKNLYQKNKDIFISELVKTAGEKRRKFLNPQGSIQRKKLSNQHISEMLTLCSNYVHNVAKVFEAFGKNPKLEQIVLNYLHLKEKSIHANYLLNQRQNEYQNLVRNLNKNQKESRSRKDLKRERLKKRKNQAAINYKQSIQNREKSRKELLRKIKSISGPINLENHEILYIAEWIHRRLKEGKNNSAISTFSGILSELSNRLETKAKQISQSSLTTFFRLPA